jgi:excisionase family DNA binding protein
MNTTFIETISVRQAAERIGVTTRTIRKWFAAGKLTRYTICGRPRVALSELEPRKTEPAAADALSQTQAQSDASTAKPAPKASTLRKRLNSGCVSYSTIKQQGGGR